MDSPALKKAATPELQAAADRIARLEGENQRLRMENDRLLEQFVRWAYNAYSRGLDEQFPAHYQRQTESGHFRKY